jgi:predicted cupin superfamily sugar epimerase
MHPRARALIADLRLSPHPQGGYFRELHRSAGTVQPSDTRGPRAALTTIYFLLTAGSHSRWHRVSSDEVWHLYEGEPIELLVADPDFISLQRIVLQAASAHSGPTHTVPAGWWQAARPLGGYALAGCTVAPGFDFSDFSFLRGLEGLTARLREMDPSLADLL